MSVYVDKLREFARDDVHPKAVKWGRIWCHMWADSEQELDQMAYILNLKFTYKQTSKNGQIHYDLTGKKREKAIQWGAKEIEYRDWLAQHNGKPIEVQIDGQAVIGITEVVNEDNFENAGITIVANGKTITSEQYEKLRLLDFLARSKSSTDGEWSEPKQIPIPELAEYLKQDPVSFMLAHHDELFDEFVEQEIKKEESDDDQ